MIRKLFIILLITQFSLLMTFASVLTEFDENFRRPILTMDVNHYCIWDMGLSKISIYSRKNLQKVSKFGRKGEGPGEFLTISTVTIYGDFVYVSHYPKLTIYSKKGKLEKIIKGPIDCGGFIPIGEKFIGKKYNYTNPSDPVSNVVFSLYDDSLKKKKDLCRIHFRKFNWHGTGKTNVLLVRDCIKAEVYDKNFVIGSSSEGLNFSVYDLEGNKIFVIQREYDKIEITDEYKNFITERQKKILKDRWQSYKARFEMVFPKYYPSFSNFAVYKQKIYVFKYPTEKSRQEILIIDFKGKLLRKAVIPLIYDGIKQDDSVCLHDEKIFYLYDNEETEKWEIRFEEINEYF